MSGPSRDGGMMSEINVTPFVDVMLVLLIIFMVTAPLMVTGVEIDLPTGDTPPLDAANDNLVIGLAANGTYSLARGTGEPTAVTLDQLGANLVEEGKQHPGQPVFVAADGTLPYQKVVEVLELAKASGVPRVGLMTEARGN